MSVMLILQVACSRGAGYIAGTGAGIVSIGGQPAQRRVYLLDVLDLSIVAVTESTATGNYLFPFINPGKQYLIIARDSLREYEPVAYDYVTPATDLTPQQQLELWQTWQT